MADTPARCKITRSGAVNAHQPCMYCPINATPVRNQRNTKSTLYPAGYCKPALLNKYWDLYNVVRGKEYKRTNEGYLVYVGVNNIRFTEE